MSKKNFVHDDLRRGFQSSGSKSAKMQAIRKIQNNNGSQQIDEIMAARRRLQAAQLEVDGLQKEVSALKACLRGKEAKVEEVWEENQKLLKELEDTREKAARKGKEAQLLEMLNSVEREKVKLVDFENTLKDRKLRHLERQVTVASVKAVFAAAASEEASARRGPGILEASLSPRSLAKLRKHAANYTHTQRKAEIKTRLSR